MEMRTTRSGQVFSKCWAFVLIVALVMAGAGESAVASESSIQTANPQTICSSVGVPAGWVVTQISASTACSPYSQLRIEQTTASDVNLTVCSNSGTLDSNWVVTHINKLVTNNPRCTSYFNEITVHQVQPADTQLQYCASGSGVPAGWAISSVSSDTSGDLCASYQPMTVARLSASPTTACDTGATISSPWVTTHVVPGQTSGPCKNFQQITLAQATANGVPMTVCGVNSTPTPDGFVISGMQAGQATGPCASYAPESIMSVGHLAVNTTINVCSVSPVPSGWVLIANNPWQAGGPCAAYATNTIRRIS